MAQHQNPLPEALAQNCHWRLTDGDLSTCGGRGVSRRAGQTFWPGLSEAWHACPLKDMAIIADVNLRVSGPSVGL